MFDTFMEKWISKEKGDGRYKGCYQFQIKRFKEDDESLAEGNYKVKVYHMTDDEFRSKLYPQSTVDFIRHRWFTRKHFRIL